ncbi:uncharacterized protein F4817DRAFT_313776 [Daldinia loculata]|uniref:uncharacterized protein n=1 Tax=Daldinia loculata TaxID=103429 RepID=UPI0020C3442B|nr:uncharacterized protein F4817DRAFT_313776 [Daldinia loculata]KAI1649639.1 hypothetical protein F4817DRAFT_313776 [Daldinia loculata]
MANGRPLCLVCDSTESKYKCARCNLYTCSLSCFREHRDNHPPVESPTPQSKDTLSVVPGDDVKSQPNYNFTGETMTHQSTSKGSEIADMPEYRVLTKKYPNLERLLWNIAAATDPPATGGDNNGKPSTFPSSNKGSRKAAQPWSKETGYENGIEVLRQVRDTPGSDRDALKEYCELVRLWNFRRESADMDADLRQQLARDNARAIGELLRTEKADV